MVKIYRLKTMLEKSQVSDFTLTHTTEESETPVVIFQGSDIVNELYNYGERLTTRNVVFLWACFKKLFWDAYYKQYEQLIKSVDVLETFKINESGYNVHSDGDKTTTRTPDTTQNYTENTRTYDYTKKLSAGTGAEQPKTETYDLSYDTAPKQTGYTLQSGATEENVKNNGAGDKTKYIDNLKVTNTESHTEISKTYSNKTLTGDKIDIHENEKSGYENSNIPDKLKNAIELYKMSILNEMILHFISKYTFYTGGDEIECEYL